jgi:hypothetical protein
VRGISLSKVNEASFAIFLAALLVSLRWESLAVSGGLALGTGLALGSLATWRYVIGQVFAAPPARDAAAGVSREALKPRGTLVLALAFLKLPVLALVVYLAIGRGWVDPLSFAAGVAIPQAAMTLLAVGRKLSAGQENGAAHAVAPRG